MKYEDIKEPLFRQAVEAIDKGNVQLLPQLLTEHPNLINERTHFPGAGYFEHPYLLWFVADNPIRNGTLPVNIIEVIQILIQFLAQNNAAAKQEQLDYALGLVSTGRIPRETGFQIAMMDVLIDAGAKPGRGEAALAHGNIVAARHLIERGGQRTLTINGVNTPTVFNLNGIEVGVALTPLEGYYSFEDKNQKRIIFY